jgi:hypothetical protein
VYNNKITIIKGPILPKNKPQKPIEKLPLGLGDRVERIAQPIARVIDKVAGTNIQGCGGCKKRREALNKAFPAHE